MIGIQRVACPRPQSNGATRTFSILAPGLLIFGGVDKVRYYFQYKVVKLVGIHQELVGKEHENYKSGIDSLGFI